MEELDKKREEILIRAYTLFNHELLDRRLKAIIETLKNALEIDLLDYYSDEQIKRLLNDVIYDENLFIKYVMPPFSTLNTRKGIWVERRNIIDDYIGDSVEGRKDHLTYSKSLDLGGRDRGTSRFDSVLVELVYKWFGFPKCKVYDSFAGGHVRGMMASLLGYKYIGIDLAKEQIEANIKRATQLGLKGITWICDDSLNVDKYVKDDSIDLYFTCPPYGDLEHYTDDPRDLCNMDYPKFIETYEEIIKRACQKLKNNRFAVIVVGDFRDKEGFYRGFVKDTITAFEKVGLKLYNQLILLTSIGSASLRAQLAFTNRKVVKVHQTVLVFFKGDVRTIRLNYKEVDSALPVPIPLQLALFKELISVSL